MRDEQRDKALLGTSMMCFLLFFLCHLDELEAGSHPGIRFSFHTLATPHTIAIYHEEKFTAFSPIAISM